MNKEIKIIFVDIDYTFFDDEIMEYDQESINALKQAQKNGILVYVNTSRPYESILQIELFNHFTPDGIVCANGGLVLYKDKVVFKNVFPQKTVQNLINFGNKHKIEVEWGTIKDRYFSIDHNKYVTPYLNTYKEHDCPTKVYDNEEVTSVLLMCPKRFDKRIKKILGDEYLFLRFHPYAIDVRYHYNDKSTGLLEALKYHNLTSDNALSIGDDFGDTAMFKVTKYSAAMGNAKDETKALATFVTESIKNHGVLIALSHFKLL